MAKVFDGIDERLAAWIARQRLFFVGTAPHDGGHVNVSPKGPIGTFAVLGRHEVAYLDLVGSGAETIAHLRDDGRICVMLCAFEGPPRIVRIHGRGEAHRAGTPAFDDLARRTAIDPERHGPGLQRTFIRIDVERVSDSCGYGVPRFTYEGERPQQEAWGDRLRRRGGVEALRDYQREHNARSIDGLPALELPPSA